MDRRIFIKSTIGTVGTAALARTPLLANTPKANPQVNRMQGLDFHIHREYPGRRMPKTMLFWDYWKIQEMNNIELVQGHPEWHPEATYIDPYNKNGGSGRVFFHEPSGKWRKIYQSAGHFFIAESEDGINWKPSPFPEIIPEGGKLAPHHVFSFPNEGPSHGWLYLDPVAADGYPYKMPTIEKMQRVYDRAKADKNHRWHELTKQFNEPRLHRIEDHIMYVSKDGVTWEVKTEYDWSQGMIFPEEPHFMFYNHLTGKHSQVCRPGLGDRRAVITTTEDFKTWSEPRLIMQPDLIDGKIKEFYAMPTFPYGQYFVGLVWASHFSNSEGPDFQVLHKGAQNPELVLSLDGEYFVRPTREPFINLNPPGKLGCNSIRPEGMVVLDDEIRIYSDGGISAHGTPLPDKLKENSRGMLLHTLRRDGFMYFQSKGFWGQFLTRAFTIFDGEFTMNAEAITGEVIIEVHSERNKPIDGYSFDEFIPLKFNDTLKHPLQWQNRKNLSELIGKAIRFNVKFYNARIYSFTGDYHIVDAHDTRRLNDGLPIMDTSRFGS
jgi:hypothetical protein